MANAKYSELVDPRLIEAAFHRMEAAKAAHMAREKLRNATAEYERAANAQMNATVDYDNLELDITRGVRPRHVGGVAS